MSAARRLGCLLVFAVLVLALPATAGAEPADTGNGIRYRVLVFTKGADSQATAAGTSAIRALGKERGSRRSSPRTRPSSGRTGSSSSTRSCS